MTAHASTRMHVRIGQLRAATHGDASKQVSQPSEQGRHSNSVGLLYSDGSPWEMDGDEFNVFVRARFVISMHKVARAGGRRCFQWLTIISFSYSSSSAVPLKCFCGMLVSGK